MLELIEAPNTAHLATSTADGSPQVSPAGIVVEGDRPAIFFSRGHLRIRKLRRRCTGEDVPVRSTIVMLIVPERVRLQELGFEHPGG
ncbi:MAG: pyridoxamine 5'-phosphate oxidase family protein [Solirubrobacterales bacterium]|nr:pyridoxamine 5'-phosphate oxidase family protein [Solirubrobacterales bacterium]